MTKDRIEELRAAQNEETSTLLGNNKDDGHLKIEIASNCTKYSVSKPVPKNKEKENKELEKVYNKVKQIREFLEKIQDDTIALRRIQDSILRTAVTTDNDDNQKQLEGSMAGVRDTLKQCRKCLTELESMQKEARGITVKRVLASQEPMLQKQYLDAVREYQDALVTHKEKTELLIKKELNIIVTRITEPTLVNVPANQKLTNEELEEMFDKQDTSVFVGNYIQETMDTRQKLQDMRDRLKDLVKLETAIAELHEMFSDMAILIENQGDIIDRVERYVGEGAELVEGGKVELNSAEKKQAKARKKKLYLVLCLTTVFAIFLIAFAVEIYIGSKT